MMEAFAQRYCLCNPGVFQSTGSGPDPRVIGVEGAGGGGDLSSWVPGARVPQSSPHDCLVQTRAMYCPSP